MTAVVTRSGSAPLQDIPVRLESSSAAPQQRAGSGTSSSGSSALSRGSASFPDLPWRLEDVLRVVVMGALGLIGIVVTYVGCSRQDNYSDQLGWLVGAIVAAAVGAVGMVGWLVTGSRRCRTERRRLESQLAASLATLAPDQQDDGPAALVSAPGMTLFHAPSCFLVQGKPGVRALSHTGADTDGLSPCPVCLEAAA